MKIISSKIKKIISNNKIIKIIISLLITFAFMYGIYGIIKDNSDKGNIYQIIATDLTVRISITVIAIIFTIAFSYFSNESVTRKNIILTTVFLICSVILIHLNINIFYKEDKINFHCLITVFALVFSICYFLFYNNYFNNKFNKVYTFILFFLVTFILLFLVELLNDNLIYKINLKIVFINYLCILVVYLLLYVITNRINIALIVGSIMFYLIGLIYYYILLFKGSPILPTDFYAIKTATSVAKNYKIKINLLILISIFLLFLICAVCRNLKVNFKIVKTEIYLKTAILIGILFFSMVANNIFDKAGASINLWNQRLGYQTNGVVVNFLMNTKYLKIKKSQNYSIAEVNKIRSKVHSQDKVKDNNIAFNKPNIIAIMNESFSDLRNIGYFNTNQDYMPFIHNLKKNTVKGNLFVSCFGGGTSTSEWEFLTGNSMSFIPLGGNPYQQYIHTPANSIARSLKDLEYDTIAMHPYEGRSWNRNKVYPLLGFDKFITKEDFENPEILRKNFISDSENYKKIIKKYEEKQKGDKLFIFNITMQNHGGYLTDNSKFKDSVYLTDKNYSDVNEYLSLIKKSDEAFEELIKYFSNQKEPTIILMFGDHLPALDVNFYKKLYQKPLDKLTLKEIQKKYTVPFIIWANYDIEEQYIDKISTNYLSTLLLDVAKLPLTSYNKFLKSAYKELPVININGYIDAQGEYYSFDKSDYQKLINDYKTLQYNNMFDTKNTLESFFRYKE